MAKATVQYTLNVGNGVWTVEEAGEEGRTMPGERRRFEVTLLDARDMDNLSIHKEGVILRPYETKVTDWYSDEEVFNTYYPEISEILLKTIPDAKRIKVFDHTRRSSSLEIQNKFKIRPSAATVHADYSENSGLNRIRQLFPEEAEELLKKHFLIVNVWRPLKTVEAYPLAFIDAQTTNSDDFLHLKRIEKNRVGEICLLKYNPKHSWYYFPEMSRNEVTIFKTFDSEGYKTTPHTAANILGQPENVSRESIEIRAVVFVE